MLIGVGQIGCSPNELAQGSPDGSTCVQKINDANQLFNSRLRSLVDDLNNNNDDAKFIYINAYGIFQDIVTSPSSFGKCVKYQKSIDFFISIHYHIPVFFNLSTTIYELRNYMCYSLSLKRYQKNEIIDIIFARLEELKMSNCALLSLFTVLENLQIRNYYEMI